MLLCNSATLQTKQLTLLFIKKGAYGIPFMIHTSCVNTYIIAYITTFDHRLTGTLRNVAGGRCIRRMFRCSQDWQMQFYLESVQNPHMKWSKVPRVSEGGIMVLRACTRARNL